MNADQLSIKADKLLHYRTLHSCAPVSRPPFQFLNKYIFNRPPQAPLQMLNKYFFNHPPLPLLQLLPLLPHSASTHHRLFPSLERRAVCLYDFYLNTRQHTVPYFYIKYICKLVSLSAQVSAVHLPYICVCYQPVPASMPHPPQPLTALLKIQPF